MQIHTLTLGQLGTNTYVIENNGKCIIIDPDNSISAITTLIDNLKLTPCAILLTHGHFDHIGGVEALRALYSINVYASVEEVELLSNSNLNLSIMIGQNYSIRDIKSILNNEQLELCDLSIKTIPTPGHTKGSLCYLINNHLFAGDTLFKNSYGRFDFPTGSLEQLRLSIKHLLTLDEQIIVYPGHGETTTISHESKFNPLR